MEKIGGVNLDYTFYPGEDLYSDGEIEDKILDIAKNFSPVEFQQKIEESGEWPVLYHLSPQRENIVDWIPIKENAKVLEIGAGCGAITGSLAKKAGSVTCVDLSRKRSQINAYRHENYDNVTITVGNFKDIEPALGEFDYIFLIGVFEYSESYMNSETPFEDMLKSVMKHMTPDGRIIIAIENRLGMKYFAGCKEDHLGTYFSGIENYPDGGAAKTFSRRALEKMFKACGVVNYSFYYPYPDYKFMTTLYSDVYLPGKGELYNNMRNFDRDRMLLFDETNAFDSVVEDGYFSVFSNSYLAVIGGILDVKFAKFSNDRAPEYRIRTEIVRTPSGEIEVRKFPLSEEANEHIKNMQVAYELLTERYAGSGLEISPCTLTEGKIPYVSFPYIQGRTLSELFDECIEKGDMDRFGELFDEYIEKIGYNENYPASDFDVAFSNVVIRGDKWTLIDYEWTFGKEIPVRELAFRAIYCYLLEDEKRNKLNLDFVLSKLEISETEAAEFRKQEMDFQKFVTGQRKSMAEIRELIGNRIITPKGLTMGNDDSEFVNRVQVYKDTGSGYSEENSEILPDAYKSDSEIEFDMDVAGDVVSLRIDPAFACCMVKVRELTLNGLPIPAANKHIVVTNGVTIKGVDDKNLPTFVFNNDDPNINIRISNLKPERSNLLHVDFKVQRIPAEFGNDIVG